MRVSDTELPGVLSIEPQVYGDDRGFLLETFHGRRYAAAGIEGPFVQDNLSKSGRGVLRGLHFQHPHGQGKLVSVVAGEVFDAAVDIRHGSPTFGHWTGAILSSENKRQLYVPPGFAHGFCTLSETVLFAYKCTDFYHPECEGCVRWNDPAIGVRWPVASPQMSDKDANAPSLDELNGAMLPPYDGL